MFHIAQEVDAHPIFTKDLVKKNRLRGSEADKRVSYLEMSVNGAPSQG